MACRKVRLVPRLLSQACALLLLASAAASPSPFMVARQPRSGRTSKVMQLSEPRDIAGLQREVRHQERNVGEMLADLESRLAEVKQMESGDEGGVEELDPLANDLAEEMLAEALAGTEQKDRELRAKGAGGFDLEHSFSLSEGEELRQQQYRNPQPQYRDQFPEQQYQFQGQYQPQQLPQQYQQFPGQGRQIEGQGTRSGLLNNFGQSMGADASTEAEGNPFPSSPQLSPSRQALEDGLEAGGPEQEQEEEVRCINKVMQVETTVWEDRIKCQHTFTEKCHDTFITDYIPTQERKCDTSFDKNCHITYKPMMFEEKVEICDEGLNKVCNNDTIGQGEEVCKTHYETTCETRFKEHEVEQDEPVCTMVTERKCRDVRVPVPEAATPRQGRRNRRNRQSRQQPELTGGLEGLEGPGQGLGGLEGNSLANLESDQDLLSIGEECEDWPVQKCTLEKKIVKKVNPETSCRKMPRDICAPSNCVFKKTAKVCRDEARQLVQNIPSEQCDLEPKETCKMETVLVPRLVQQPNCIKVPKEICINVKSNPRKVKKPVVKEWCYKPSDLKASSTRLALSQFFSN